MSAQDVGVFDATNTTDERRKKVLDHTLKFFGPDDIKVRMRVCVYFVCVRLAHVLLVMVTVHAAVCVPNFYIHLYKC